MKAGTFIATKVNGKAKIWDRDGMDAVIAEYGDGEDFQITIEEMHRKRTRAQEKFFHGPILKAFMTLGNGKQEAKDMLALMFIPRDIRMLDGSIVRVPGSTSALSVEEYSDLIENCIRLAAENRLIIEDVEEWKRTHRRAA